jgi:hypothetical protein
MGIRFLIRFGILLAFWGLIESLANSDQQIYLYTCLQGWYTLEEHY